MPSHICHYIRSWFFFSSFFQNKDKHTHTQRVFCQDMLRTKGTAAPCSCTLGNCTRPAISRKEKKCFCVRVPPVGTATEDTLCQLCPPGTFSRSPLAQSACLPHRHCSSTQRQLVKGTSWHDIVCSNPGESQGEDLCVHLHTAIFFFTFLVIVGDQC